MNNSVILLSDLSLLPTVTMSVHCDHPVMFRWLVLLMVLSRHMAVGTCVGEFGGDQDIGLSEIGSVSSTCFRSNIGDPLINGESYKI